MISMLTRQMSGIVLTAAAACVLGSDALEAQDNADSVTITANAAYAAGWIARPFLGSGHRSLWTEPIRVPVLGLGHLGDGLKPLREGGGRTTSTLHLEDSTGRRWVLRSVVKDPINGPLEEFRGTIGESFLHDQISAFHPAGAAVAAALLDATDILHVTPRLLVMADDPGLEEFREEFAGQLLWFEQRPGSDADASQFGGATEVMNSEEMFEELRDSPRQRVDAVAFLEARLVDLVLGDRDRAVDNWRWAAVPNLDAGPRATRLLPIPRDRDQALIDLDGWLKALARPWEPRFVAFGSEVGSVDGLSRNAWDMDRRFLVEVDKPHWDEAVAKIQSQLTDAAIEDAVAAMPGPYVDLTGAELAARLRGRRDDLPRAADKLYGLVTWEADVWATDEKDLASVERLEDGRLRVTLSRAENDRTYFDRTFDPHETREVRIYLLDDDDRLEVFGSGPANIGIRAIGGDDADRFSDSTTVMGRGIQVYDKGDASEFMLGDRARIHEQSVTPPRAWGEEATPRDWGSTWMPAPALAVNSDVGVFLALGAQRIRYEVGTDPYRSRLLVQAGIASEDTRLFFLARMDRPHALGSADLAFQLRWSGIDRLNFFGLGNDSFRPLEDDVARANHGIFSASTSIGIDRGWGSVSVGPKLQFTTVESGQPTVVGSLVPYGIGDLWLAGVEANGRLVLWDADSDPPLSVQNRNVPAGGQATLEGQASFYPGILDADRGSFGIGRMEFRAGGRMAGGRGPGAAITLGAEQAWGPTPFFHLAAIGGPRVLRGYPQERFTGDQAAYGTLELRQPLGLIHILLPTEVGIIGLVDMGRVWLDSESPGGWRTSAGGGIWLAPLRRSFASRVLVVNSEEGTIFRVVAGIPF